MNQGCMHVWYTVNNTTYSLIVFNLLKKKKHVVRKKESEVAQSCPTLCDAMDCSQPGSSILGILQQEYIVGIGKYIFYSKKNN